MADEVVEEYSSSLADLTFNSKPLINMLTMLADDHVQYAAEIVQVIEAHIQKTKSSEKLPALYLLDSIIKNISNSSYPRLFAQNLVSMFCGVFEKVDEKTRQAMWKLRQTWSDIIPNKRLYALDIRIQMIDPAWPVTAQPPEEPIASIHVNPKFLIKEEAEAKAKKDQEEQEALMRQQLLAKQQELLKLQQERLELELAEAKARLVSQAKQLESQPSQLPGPPTQPPKPKVLTTPKVEASSSPSGEGSPVQIPTIAVQGIVRDPRLTIRDPRLSSESPPPPKAPSTAAKGKSTKSTSKASASQGGANASASSSKHKSSSRPGGSPGKSSAGRDPRDNRLRDHGNDRSAHSASSSKTTGGKKVTPIKTRPSSDKKDAVEHKKSADRFGVDGHGRRGKGGASSGVPSTSTRSAHRSSPRRGSRSLSPEKDPKSKISGSRSRSRSPHRSPRGSSMEKKEKSRSPRDFREDKRQRSPEVDVPEKQEPIGESPDEFAAPPTKKSKPEEAADSALPPDFRELFGNEDQDYRRPPSYAKGPSTPSTPGTPSTGRWAAFKAERPEEFPFQQPRLMLDMPSPSGRYQDVDMRSPPLRRMSVTSQSSASPISPEQLNISIPAPLMLEQLDSILTEADAQLRAGRLSHEQHQAILKQLGELQKLQKLKQQLRSQVSPVDKPGSAAAPPAVDDTGYSQPGVPQRPIPPPDLALPTRPAHAAQPIHPAAPRLEPNNEGMVPNYDGRPPPDHYQRDPAYEGENRGPPHMAEPRPLLRPPGPDFPESGLRERAPHPKPNMPPMMRPPLPPHLTGGLRPRLPGPRFDGPPRRGGNNQRAFIAHLVGGHYRLPYDTNKYYVPEHDPRWTTPMNDSHQHKLYIDDRAYELPLGCPPRQIMLGTNRVQISVDTSSRGIKIDGICYYKIGDNPRKVTINGNSHLISYQGPEKKIWIDEQAFEVYTDGPPQPIFISGKEYKIHIDSIMNQVVIDNQIVCPFGGPKKQIEFGYEKHEVQFEPPPRKILIDGKLCEMNFKGKYPCVNMEGLDYGIRFDGPPREIIINNKPWTVDMDIPRKARIASERIHIIAFGGPGHEIIINGQWYEIKFNGPEKAIHLGSKLVHIRLIGPPPEVKILGAVVKDPQKVQELVGDAYIDPTIAVLSTKPSQSEGPPPKRLDAPRPFDQGPRPQMGLDMPPRPPILRGTDRGRPPRMPDMGRGGVPLHMRGRDGPPRGGFHDGPRGPHPQRALPPHMDDRGRGSPQYDDEGRNSPDQRNLPPENFGPMHDMDFDRHHRPDGGPPQQQYPPQRPSFGGPPPQRGYRQQHPRMRGNRGHGPRMGHREEYYPQGPRGMRGGLPRGGMRGPPPLNGPPPPHRDDFNQYHQGPPPPQEPFYGMPNFGPPAPPNVTSQVDVNDLFSKLINSGIIKKAGDEAPAPVAPTPTTANNAPAVSAAAVSTANNQAAVPAATTDTMTATTTTKEGEVKKEEEKPKPIPKPKEHLANVPDLTDFDVKKMKTPNMGVIQRMYGGIQCSSCGVRFITEDMDKYREHLDWHFRQNRRDKDGIKVAKFRQWYYTTNEWIQFEEIGDLEERAHSMYFEKLLQTQALPGSTGALQTIEAPISCPAATGNADDDVCEMCGEQFENFFDEDSEEWRLRDAIRVGNKTYHPACYEDVGEIPVSETPTPEAAGPETDPITNPLAFLSKLTATAPPTDTAPPTSTAPTSTAGPTITAAGPDVKPTIVKTEIKTEPTDSTPAMDTTPATDSKPPQGLSAVAPTATTVDTTIVKTEPLSQITTLGSTS